MSFTGLRAQSRSHAAAWHASHKGCSSCRSYTGHGGSVRRYRTVCSRIAARKQSCKTHCSLHQYRQCSRQHSSLAMARPRAEEASEAESSLLENGTGQQLDPEKQRIDWLITSLAFLFPALGGALFGYDIGATSGALVSLKNAATSGTSWYELTSFQSGLVVSSSLFGALAGSAAAFVVGDPLGRKRELLLAAALYSSAAATTYLAPSLNILLVGRVLYGLGIGFAMHAAPAYIAETAPARVRGLLISLKECLIVVGILMGYLTSYLLINEVGGWRAMFGVSIIPAVVLGSGMLWLPDSPRWVLLSGQGRAAAQAAVERLRGRFAAQEVVDAEVDKMVATTSTGKPSASFASLFQGSNLRPLTIGMSLMLLQQITGQPSVLYYAAEIFRQAGFASGQESTGVSVFLGFFKLVATGVAVAKVDSVGRRPLLLWGVSGMVVALLGLSASSLVLGGSLGTWASVIALLMYVGAYQVSFGPISWLIVGEVFPLAVRGPATALATLTNFGSNFLVSLVLPSVQDGIGAGYTYLVFAGLSVVAVATIYSLVPETKGKTLEQIEAMWKQ